jgi:hypothetical protein
MKNIFFEISNRFFIPNTLSPTHHSGVKKSVYPLLITPSPTPTTLKKNPNGLGRCRSGAIVQRFAGLEMGKEKWGSQVSDCFCAYAHRKNRGIFFW